MNKPAEFTGFLYDQGDRIALLKAVLDELSNLDTDFSIIHVCGTNGKGSTSAMIASVLKQLHYRVGMFTSPFIGNVTNGIQINGQNISSSDRQAALETIEKIMQLDRFKGQKLSEFEAEFVASMIYFSRQKVDYVVLECGLGGELDATNAVSTTMYSIFTKIGLDHIGILGDTIQEIATTKSKIIQPNNVTIVAPNQRPAAFDVISKEAQSKSAHLISAQETKVAESDVTPQSQLIQFQRGKISGKFQFSLQGTYQIENVATVITWLLDFVQRRHIDVDIDRLLTDALANINVPGRFEELVQNPKIIVDGAHNLDAISAFVDTVDAKFNQFHKVIITGFLKDKDYTDCVELLTQIHDVSFRLTSPDNPKRALSAKSLQATFKHFTQVDYPTFSDPISALKATVQEVKHQKDTIILVAGSFYLLNPIRTFIKDGSFQNDK